MSRPKIATNCKVCGRFAGYSDDCFCQNCCASLCIEHGVREDPRVFVRQGQVVEDTHLCHDCARRLATRECWTYQNEY